MRIVAGAFGGRRIVAPSGLRSRPTSARVREAVFSMVGEAVTGVSVLDLFAGSGALALEALSRGAASADLVDTDTGALRAIGTNIASLDAHERTRVRRMSWDAALRADRREGRLYGLVLLDPPYSLIPDIRTRIAVALMPVLAPGAFVVAEGPRGEPGWPGIELPYRERRHGGTSVTVYQRGPRA